MTRLCVFILLLPQNYLSADVSPSDTSNDKLEDNAKILPDCSQLTLSVSIKSQDTIIQIIKILVFRQTKNKSTDLHFPKIVPFYFRKLKTVSNAEKVQHALFKKTLTEVLTTNSSKPPAKIPLHPTTTTKFQTTLK